LLEYLKAAAAREKKKAEEQLQQKADWERVKALYESFLSAFFSDC